MPTGCAAAPGSSAFGFLPPRNSSVPRISGDSKRQAQDHAGLVQLGSARRGGDARNFLPGSCSGVRRPARRQSKATGSGPAAPGDGGMKFALLLDRHRPDGTRPMLAQLAARRARGRRLLVFDKLLHVKSLLSLEHQPGRTGDPRRQNRNRFGFAVLLLLFGDEARGRR